MSGIADAEGIEIELAFELQIENGFSGDVGVDFVPASFGLLDVEKRVDLVEGHRDGAGNSRIVDDFAVDDLYEPHTENIAKFFGGCGVCVGGCVGGGGDVAAPPDQIAEADEVLGVRLNGDRGNQWLIQSDLFDDDRLTDGRDFGKGYFGMLAGDDVDGVARVLGIIRGQVQVFKGDGERIFVSQLGEAQFRVEVGIGDSLYLRTDPFLDRAGSHVLGDKEKCDAKPQQNTQSQDRDSEKPPLH